MVAFVLAESPALPLHTAGKYVAAAYVVAFAVVLIYVAVMAIRLSHVERDLGELLALSERSEQEPSAPAMAADPERESVLP
ncbi:MAG TPA: hypothetical protein VFY36_12535 [Solirubrobacteraceae bacterium]|nr:hypothetical protein [Solirubrobacteraceae bacterium]